MKKTLLLFLIFALFASGCDTYGMMNLYPQNKADVWYCEQIAATIDFTGDSSSLNTEFIWNGETHKCHTAFFSTYVNLVVDKNGNGMIEPPEEEILEGHWKYNKKKVTIEIINSNLFGDAFTELTFVPLGNQSK
jgi:hypothetical protein